MPRILTGIQSTGTPHLGNILGAILPAIEMAMEPGNDAFLFIADMHSLTQIKGCQVHERMYLFCCSYMARPLGWTRRKVHFTDKVMCPKLLNSLGIYLAFSLIKDLRLHIHSRIKEIAWKT